MEMGLLGAISVIIFCGLIYPLLETYPDDIKFIKKVIKKLRRANG